MPLSLIITSLQEDSCRHEPVGSKAITHDTEDLMYDRLIALHSNNNTVQQQSCPLSFYQTRFIFVWMAACNKAELKMSDYNLQYIFFICLVLIVITEEPSRCALLSACVFVIWCEVLLGKHTVDSSRRNSLPVWMGLALRLWNHSHVVNSQSKIIKSPFVFSKARRNIINVIKFAGGEHRSPL